MDAATPPDIPVGLFSVLLVILIALSAFFSSSETAIVALNRYRLRHLAEEGHRGAALAQQLLERPERLLGTILLGNNIANLSASAVTTLLANALYGEFAIAIATGILTIVILVFAEVPPKTLAARHPERIAFWAVFILHPLVKVAYPVVWLITVAGEGLMRLLRQPIDKGVDSLSAAELRTVVRESARRIPKSHHDMLIRILELENITVDDVMVPRSSVEAINLDDDWDDIVEQLTTSHHTRLPVYQGTLDQVLGTIHLRKVLYIVNEDDFDLDTLKTYVRQPFFVSEDARITQLLLTFQHHKRQLGLVVDEYGDFKGIVSLDDVFEEIVGEYGAQIPGIDDDAHVEEDGSYLVDARANVRDLNRRLHWHLPTDGPKTLNGLIVEYLEDIPAVGTCLRLGNMVVEIVQTRGTSVLVARVKYLPPRVDVRIDPK